MRVQSIISACDDCGKQLYGKAGTTFIERPYIAMKGTMLVKNPELNDFFYVTRNATDELQFCNLDCLGNFIDRRKAEWERVKERSLRQEATDDLLTNSKK